MKRLHALFALVLFVFVCVIGCGERITFTTIDVSENSANSAVIEVEEISYYADEELSTPIDRGVAGDTIYTKVVFSQVPSEVYITYQANPFAEQLSYHIVSDTFLQDGEAMPLHGNPQVFVCKQTLGGRSYAHTEVAIPRSLDHNLNDTDILSSYRGDSDNLAINYSGNGGDDTVFIDFIEFDEDVSGHHAYAGAGYVLVYRRSLQIDPFRIHVHNQKDGGLRPANFTVNPGDFFGLVLAPFIPTAEDRWLRLHSKPVEGVTLTVLSGPHRGEVAITDTDGWYLFPDVEEDELLLLVERDHFETKEVTVHRSLPTQLSDGTTPLYEHDPQQFNGVILIGQRWPDEVRFVFEQVEVVPDLLWMEGGTNGGTNTFNDSDVLGRYYHDGVIICYGSDHGSLGDYLNTLVHEIFHAHQDFVVSPDGLGNVYDWVYTDEGRSFVEAKEKDWEEVGKTEYDSIKHYSDSYLENAAHTAALFFGAGRWELTRHLQEDLTVVAPNRYQWCQEWLK